MPDFFFVIILRRSGGGIEGRRGFGDTERGPREREEDEDDLAPLQQGAVQQAVQDRVEEEERGGGFEVELLDDEAGLADEVG